MKISDSYRKTIIDEINYAVKMINKTENAEERLYFFSSIHGVINRVFNFEFDLELVSIHFILQSTHNALLQRIQAMKGGETIIPVYEQHFKSLTSACKELAKKIKSDEDISPTLQKFILLIYSTTGNGYYLLQKGIYKL